MACGTKLSTLWKGSRSLQTKSWKRGTQRSSMTLVWLILWVLKVCFNLHKLTWGREGYFCWSKVCSLFVEEIQGKRVPICCLQFGSNAIRRQPCKTIPWRWNNRTITNNDSTSWQWFYSSNGMEHLNFPHLKVFSWSVPYARTTRGKERYQQGHLLSQQGRRKGRHTGLQRISRLLRRLVPLQSLFALFATRQPQRCSKMAPACISHWRCSCQILPWKLVWYFLIEISSARYNVGGPYIEKDEARAFQLFKEAADKGHAPSCHNVAIAYLSG